MARWRSATGARIDFVNSTVSSSEIAPATPTAISTVPEMPPPLEVSAATMKPEITLIAGSTVSIRVRSETVEQFRAIRGLTDWLMSTSTGRIPTSTAR